MANAIFLLGALALLLAVAAGSPHHAGVETNHAGSNMGMEVPVHSPHANAMVFTSDKTTMQYDDKNLVKPLTLSDLHRGNGMRAPAVLGASPQIAPQLSAIPPNIQTRLQAQPPRLEVKHTFPAPGVHLISQPPQQQQPQPPQQQHPQPPQQRPQPPAANVQQPRRAAAPAVAAPHAAAPVAKSPFASIVPIAHAAAHPAAHPAAPAAAAARPAVPAAAPVRLAVAPAAAPLAARPSPASRPAAARPSPAAAQFAQRQQQKPSSNLQAARPIPPMPAAHAPALAASSAHPQVHRKYLAQIAGKPASKTNQFTPPMRNQQQQQQQKGVVDLSKVPVLNANVPAVQSGVNTTANSKASSIGGSLMALILVGSVLALAVLGIGKFLLGSKKK